jgi:hypothetical protein
MLEVETLQKQLREVRKQIRADESVFQQYLLEHPEEKSVDLGEDREFLLVHKESCKINRKVLQKHLPANEFQLLINQNTTETQSFQVKKRKRS